MQRIGDEQTGKESMTSPGILASKTLTRDSSLVPVQTQIRDDGQIVSLGCSDGLDCTVLQTAAAHHVLGALKAN